MATHPDDAPPAAGPPAPHKLTFAFATDAAPTVVVTHGPGWTHVDVSFAEARDPSLAAAPPKSAQCFAQMDAAYADKPDPRLGAEPGPAESGRILHSEGRRNGPTKLVAAPKDRGATPYDVRIRNYAQTVVESIGRHGSAPDFAAQTKAGHRKAANYIRSVVGEPAMSDVVVKQIRRAVAIRLAHAQAGAESRD